MFINYTALSVLHVMILELFTLAVGNFFKFNYALKTKKSLHASLFLANYKLPIFYTQRMCKWNIHYN